MAKLFVANLSLQHHEFIYVVPERGGHRTQRIEVGRQVQIGGDAAPEVLAAIVAQHERYGMVSVREVQRQKVFTGLCYQFDKPIMVDAILAGIEANKRQLERDGAEMRRLASAASGHVVRESLYREGMPQVRNFSVEIEEQAPSELKGQDRVSFDKTKLHETVAVDLTN